MSIFVSESLHDQFHDAASEISSITISSSEEDTASRPLTVTDEIDLASDMRAEAEDGCGELNSRAFPSRTANTKRFSSLSMASSIAAIMPFVTASENKLSLGFAPPNDRDTVAKASLSSDVGKNVQQYNRKRLRGSMPQLSLLLQRAAANAQSESTRNFSAKTVDEWASSLAKSFDIDSPSPEVALRYPVAEVPQIPLHPQPKELKEPKQAKHAKQHEGSTTRWKLRPLSTWGRKSMVNPLWSSAPPHAPSHASSQSPQDPSAAPMTESLSSLIDCDDSVISALSNASASATRPLANTDKQNASNLRSGGGANQKLASTKPEANSTSSLSTSTTKESGTKPPSSKFASHRFGTSWTPGNKRASTANLRNSRFWQMVRPSTGQAPQEKDERLSSPSSCVSELSELASEGTTEPQSGNAAKSQSGSGPGPKTSDGPEGTNKQKRSRLRKFWQSIVSNGSLQSLRNTNKPCPPYTFF